MFNPFPQSIQKIKKQTEVPLLRLMQLSDMPESHNTFWYSSFPVFKSMFSPLIILPNNVFATAV